MRTSAVVLALVSAVAAGAVAAAPPESPAPVTHDEAKPTGPIAVDVHLDAEPALGVPLTVTVMARADGVDRLDLEVRADDPAALVIGAVSPPLDRAGARRWIVTVVPVRASGGYLSVVVAGEIDGVAQARSVVVAIRPAGAEAPARAPSAAPAGAGGENLSLLPVEERF
jgi:hypothetical protein